MKMTATHFDQLKAMICNHQDHIDDYVEACRTMELSERRIRWDLLWNVPHSSRVVWFDEVYKYLDDTHIDTALKAVVKQLTA